MKKFLLALLVPFLMVSGIFAYEFDTSTDYDGDDVTVEFEDLGDGDFNFSITNHSGDTIYCDFDKSLFFVLDDLLLPTGEGDMIFTDDDIMDDFDVIEDGYKMTSEPFYVDDDYYMGYYIVLTIDGDDYTWFTVVQ